MLSRPFTYKRVEALRPAVQRITDQHIDEILSGPKPVDLVESLALAIPSLVISEMLGVPYDAEFFQEQANKGMSRTPPRRNRPRARAPSPSTWPTSSARRSTTRARTWCPISPSG
jgi:cytochrome P450